MPKRGLLAALTLVLFSYPSRAADTGPSFDCSKAEACDEKIICSDPALSKADLEIASAYKNTLSRIPKDHREALQVSQRGWLKDRTLNACNSDSEVFAQIFKSRIAERIDELKTEPTTWKITGTNRDDLPIAELLHTICRKDGSCQITARYHAGIDDHNNEMFLIETIWPSATWLVHSKNKRILKWQKLGDKLYGDATGEELEDRLQDGVLPVPVRCGNFAWMGCQYFSWKLNPLKPISLTEGNHAGGIYMWKWDTFSGSGWQRQYANAGETNESSVKSDYLFIPAVSISPDFWDKTLLGNCALSLSAKDGYLISKVATVPAGFEIKALYARDYVLIVNVFGAEPNDQLQLGNRLIRVLDGKVLTQGTVNPLNPVDVKTRELVDGQGRRVQVLRIAGLGKPWTETTPEDNSFQSELTYRAVDEKAEVQWRLASAAFVAVGEADGGDWKPMKNHLHFNDIEATGRIFHVDPKYGTCVPDNGVLNSKVATEFNPDEPLF